MKLISLLSIPIFTIIFAMFFNCSTSKQLQDPAPIQIGEAYYQYWTAGVKGGGAGVDVYLPVLKNPDNIQVDSIYFRNMGAKLDVVGQSNDLLVGHLINGQNKQEDLILSIDPNEEYKNQLPKEAVVMPFAIKDDECIISYNEKGIVKYFNVSGIVEKESNNLPNIIKNN